jgi:hypothetical protein
MVAANRERPNVGRFAIGGSMWRWLCVAMVWSSAGAAAQMLGPDQTGAADAAIPAPPADPAPEPAPDPQPDPAPDAAAAPPVIATPFADGATSALPSTPAPQWPPQLPPSSPAQLAAAQVQPIATRPTLIVVAERLFGVHAMTWTMDVPENATLGVPEQSVEFSSTQVRLLWGESNDGTGGSNPMAIPHLSVHGVVGSGFTLGGSLGYTSTVSEVEVDFEVDGESVSQDAPELTEYLLGARVGYLVVPNATVSVWLRTGISFYSVDIERNDPDGQTATQNALVLNVDPMLVFTPVEHVGLLLGPVFDIEVAGGREERSASWTDEETVDADTGGTNFGLVAGIALLI